MNSRGKTTMDILNDEKTTRSKQQQHNNKIHILSIICFSFQVQFYYSAVGAEKQAGISGFQERCLYGNIFSFTFIKLTIF